MNPAEIAGNDIDILYERLYREAEAGGYHLNPDVEFTKELVKGLIVNERRYGYRACPCRLASGNKAEDIDIICPCDYRDADVVEYNACYCALYVSEAALKDRSKIKSIPERRPPPQERQKKKTGAASGVPAAAGPLKLPLPVWRCKVCGYLCARDAPPEVCPVCKAKKERFERFI
ncbi:MAG: ferredoxin-thioredoxin reductase catalytic domain-containing protein [Dehalococcoidales bacterium]